MELLAVAASLLATTLAIHVPVDLDAEFLPEDNRTLQFFYAWKKRQHICGAVPDSFVYDSCVNQGDEVMISPSHPFFQDEYRPFAGPCGSCQNVSDNKAYVIFCNERGDRTSVAYYSDRNTCNQLITTDPVWGFNHSQHHVVPLGDDNAVCEEWRDEYGEKGKGPAVCPDKRKGICWGSKPRIHLVCGGKTKAQCTSPCKWDTTTTLNQRRIYVEITDFKRSYKCVDNQCVMSASGLSQSDCQAVCGPVV